MSLNVFYKQVSYIIYTLLTSDQLGPTGDTEIIIPLFYGTYQAQFNMYGMVDKPVLRRDGASHSVGVVVFPCEQAGTGKLGWQQHGRPWDGLIRTVLQRFYGVVPTTVPSFYSAVPTTVPCFYSAVLLRYRNLPHAFASAMAKLPDPLSPADLLLTESTGRHVHGSTQYGSVQRVAELSRNHVTT
ncbi:hypothetical protein V499_07634 [Pseudogymnoascus sp. VKM F-103]|nr:hypothetical protein V499_07634 [Pseudogymnoascus sp. VKM F-103]